MEERFLPGFGRLVGEHFVFVFGSIAFRLEKVAMSNNLYVGNLPYGTTSGDLTEAFGQFGTVTRVQIISDRVTGRSRGFGFVEMEDGGTEAIDGMNGSDFQGRTLTVNEARPRKPRGESF